MRRVLTIVAIASLLLLDGQAPAPYHGNVEIGPVYNVRDAEAVDILARFTNVNPQQAHTLTNAVLYYARHVGINPVRLAQRIIVESHANPTALGPPVYACGMLGRAMGLGQIISACWWGVYPQCGTRSLLDIDTNVCYAAHIWKYYYLASDGKVDEAHRKYLGCVRCTHDAAYIAAIEGTL